MASVEPQQTVISRFGIGRRALGALEFFGDGVAKRFRAPGDGVLIDVGGDGFLGGALDFGGRGKIREALGEIDGAVADGQARHFANDGFGEALGLGGKLRSREFVRQLECTSLSG